jgi:hypothetical protein
VAGTAIVWATAPTADPDHTTVGGNVYAYDANDLGTLLWSTAQNPSRDSYGKYAKFVAPTIASGRVYIGTDSGQVAVYGLLPVKVSPPTGIASNLQMDGAGWRHGTTSTAGSGANVSLGR